MRATYAHVYNTLFCVRRPHRLRSRLVRSSYHTRAEWGRHLEVMLHTQDLEKRTRRIASTIARALHILNAAQRTVSLQRLQRTVGRWSWRPSGGIARHQIRRVHDLLDGAL